MRIGGRGARGWGCDPNAAQGFCTPKDTKLHVAENPPVSHIWLVLARARRVRDTARSMTDCDYSVKRKSLDQEGPSSKILKQSSQT